MAALCVFVVLLSCALSTYSAPAIKKRQADQVDAMCASLIAQNASNSYTVEISEDCTQFAQCLSEGGYTVANCSAGLLFDPLIGGCQYANLVACARNPCNGQPDGVAIADPRGCAHFYGCSGGVPMPLSCPPGQRFGGNACVPDDNCAYVEPTTVAMSPEEMCLAKGFRRIPGDDTKYLVIQGGNLPDAEMPCAPGTAFDETCTCSFLG